jgi:hypothetical protein
MSRHAPSSTPARATTPRSSRSDVEAIDRLGVTRRLAMHGRRRQTAEEREQRREANIERVQKFNALQVRGCESERERKARRVIDAWVVD